MSPTVNLIVAVDKNMGIGYNNQLPWEKNKEDMKLFRRLTTGGVVVMGRKTYESVGILPNRVNVVVSNTVSSELIEKSVVWAGGRLSGVVAMLGRLSRPLWVIGGARIYEQALLENIVDELHFSCFPQVYRCDVHFPILAVSTTFTVCESQAYEGFDYVRYKRAI